MDKPPKDITTPPTPPSFPKENGFWAMGASMLLGSHDPNKSATQSPVGGVQEPVNILGSEGWIASMQVPIEVPEHSQISGAGMNLKLDDIEMSEGGNMQLYPIDALTNTQMVQDEINRLKSLRHELRELDSYQRTQLIQDGVVNEDARTAVTNTQINITKINNQLPFLLSKLRILQMAVTMSDSPTGHSAPQEQIEEPQPVAQPTPVAQARRRFLDRAHNMLKVTKDTVASTMETMYNKEKIRKLKDRSLAAAKKLKEMGFTESVLTVGRKWQEMPPKYKIAIGIAGASLSLFTGGASTVVTRGLSAVAFGTTSHDKALKWLIEEENKSRREIYGDNYNEDEHLFTKENVDKTDRYFAIFLGVMAGLTLGVAVPVMIKNFDGILGAVGLHDLADKAKSIGHKAVDGIRSMTPDFVGSLLAPLKIEMPVWDNKKYKDLLKARNYKDMLVMDKAHRDKLTELLKQATTRHDVVSTEEINKRLETATKFIDYDTALLNSQNTHITDNPAVSAAAEATKELPVDTTKVVVAPTPTPNATGVFDVAKSIEISTGDTLSVLLMENLNLPDTLTNQGKMSIVYNLFADPAGVEALAEMGITDPNKILADKNIDLAKLNKLMTTIKIGNETLLERAARLYTNTK